MFYNLILWLTAPIWLTRQLIRKMSGKVGRVVILTIGGIGDLVIAAPIIEALKHKYPQANLDIIVHPIARDLFRDAPNINSIIAFHPDTQKGIAGKWRLAQLLRGTDVAICLVPAHAQWVAMCWAGIPQKLSLLFAPFSSIYRPIKCFFKVQEHREDIFILQSQWTLLAHLAIAPPDVITKKLLPWKEYAAPDWFNQEYVWIGIFFGAGRKIKSLTLEQVVALILHLKDQKPVIKQLGFILLGGENEKPLANQIVQVLSAQDNTIEVINACALWRLAEIPSMINRLNYYVGVDSGLTHIADALAKTMWVISGPIVEQEVYQQRSNLFLVNSYPPCHPCSDMRRVTTICAQQHNQCMNMNVTSIKL